MVSNYGYVIRWFGNSLLGVRMITKPSYYRVPRVHVLLSTALALGIGASAHAQTAADTAAFQREIAHRVVAVVAIASVPNANNGIVIIRRANLLPHDVIVLPSAGVTAQQVATAVKGLQLSRRVSGDNVQADMTVQTGSSQAPDTKAADLSAAQRVLARLQSGTETQQIAGIGTVPAVRIWPKPVPHPAAGSAAP